MIKTDEQLKSAQSAVRNLEQILERARKTHQVREYRAMSEPILLELQQRELDILKYLSLAESQVAGL